MLKLCQHIDEIFNDLRWVFFESLISNIEYRFTF